jgi:hypothetical protein
VRDLRAIERLLRGEPIREIAKSVKVGVKKLKRFELEIQQGHVFVGKKRRAHHPEIVKTTILELAA